MSLWIRMAAKGSERTGQSIISIERIDRAILPNCGHKVTLVRDHAVLFGTKPIAIEILDGGEAGLRYENGKENRSHTLPRAPDSDLLSRERVLERGEIK